MPSGSSLVPYPCLAEGLVAPPSALLVYYGLDIHVPHGLTWLYVDPQPMALPLEPMQPDEA